MQVVKCRCRQGGWGLGAGSKADCRCDGQDDGERARMFHARILSRCSRCSRCSSTLSDWFAESCLKNFPVAAAQRQTRAGAKEYDVFAVERRLHFLNAIDVDDRRAVDPDELLRVELRFEVAHGVAHEMLLPPDVHTHVVALCLAPVDVGHPHEMNAAARL